MRLLLLCALVACGSSAPPVGPSHKAAAPMYEASLDDVLGFLPVDSEIVVVVDAHQIRGSQIWAALAPRVEKEMGGDLNELRTACGFDPLQTVERVSIGLRTYDKNPAGVVVVHGVGAGMMGCVKSRFGKGGAVVDEGSIVIIRDGRDQTAWTVIGSTLIIEVDTQVTRDSLQAVLASGSPLRTSHAFMAMYDKLDHGKSIVGIANGRSHMFDELDSEGIRPATLWGTLNISDHITLDAHATYADEAAASKLDTMLKGAFGSIGKLVERAESHVDGRHIDVGMSMSGAQLQSLVGNF